MFPPHSGHSRLLGGMPTPFFAGIHISVSRVSIVKPSYHNFENLSSTIFKNLYWPICSMLDGKPLCEPFALTPMLFNLPDFKAAAS